MPRNSFFLLILSCLMLSSCGSVDPLGLSGKLGLGSSKTGIKRWGKFPIPIYASRALSTNNEFLRDLRDGVQYWESRSSTNLFVYRGAWNGDGPIEGSIDSPSDLKANIIFFANKWRWESDVAGKTITLSKDSQIENGMIILNRNHQYCSGMCPSNMGPTVSLRRVLTHELGHLIGMEHSGDQQDIMHPILPPDGGIENSRYNRAQLSALLEPFD